MVSYPMNNIVEGFLLPVIGIILCVVSIIYCSKSEDNINSIVSNGSNELSKSILNELETIDGFLTIVRVLLYIDLVIFLIIFLLHLFGETIIDEWIHLPPSLLLTLLLIGTGIILGVAIDKLVHIYDLISTGSDELNRGDVTSTVRSLVRDSKSNAITALLFLVGIFMASISMLLLRISSTNNDTYFVV